MAFDKRKSLQNALTFTQQGKWDRAIAEYQAILKADPRDLTVCNNLGDLYARAGKVSDAIEQYVKLGESCTGRMGCRSRLSPFTRRLPSLTPPTSRPIRPAPISTGSRASSARPRSR